MFKGIGRVFKKEARMKYTIRVRYTDGFINTWMVSDRETARFIIQKEMNRYGKSITNLTLKGVRV